MAQRKAFANVNLTNAESSGGKRCRTMFVGKSESVVKTQQYTSIQLQQEVIFSMKAEGPWSVGVEAHAHGRG